jgi:hypothetical protein
MKYKFKIKAMILFERIANKAFELKSTIDLYLYFYCIRMVNMDNYTQDFESFLDECDENPELLTDFLAQFEAHNKRQANTSS